MRNIFTILLVCLFFNGCSSTDMESSMPTKSTSTLFAVEGMMCEKGCKSYLTTQIEKFPGVQNCDINFSEKTLIVDFNENEVNVKTLVESVASLMDGRYSISELSSSEKIDSKSTPNNSSDKAISVVDFAFKLPNLTHLFSNWL